MNPAPIPTAPATLARVESKGFLGPEGWLARNYRYRIALLLFFVTALSYTDRQVIAVLEPMLTKTLGWSNADFGHIVMSFQIAYGVGYLVMGRFIDFTGVRWGLGLAVGVWSLFTVGHGLVTTVLGFCIMRAMLGLAEGGNFPGAIKAATHWFPLKERAFVKGFFNAGGSLGAKLTPFLVPLIAIQFGWQAAFYVTGGLGLVFLFVWFKVYHAPRDHAKVSPEELAYIETNEALPTTAEKISWVGLLKYRMSWAFTFGMLFTNPIWVFYLFYMPKFLTQAFDKSIGEIAWPLLIFFLMSDLGGMAGGLLSLKLLRRGWSVRKSRMTALLVSLCCVMPLMLVPFIDNMWLAAVVVGLAGAAHQGWSSNISAMIGDVMPYKTVSTIVGFGGAAGSFGSLWVTSMAVDLLNKTGSLSGIFLGAPVGYVIAFLLIYFINPFKNLKPTNLKPAT